MYKIKKMRETSIDRNESMEGETLETKIERIVNNKEPITDGAPTIYTERAEGVLPGYDIRTDRFDVAIEAMDKVAKTHQSKRADRIKKAVEEYNEAQGGTKSDGEPKSTQGTTE